MLSERTAWIPGRRHIRKIEYLQLPAYKEHSLIQIEQVQFFVTSVADNAIVKMIRNSKKQ